MADRYLTIPRAVYVRQTPKAVLFRIGRNQEWIPRSHLRSRKPDWEDYDGEIEITAWIAQQKNISGDPADENVEETQAATNHLTVTTDDIPNAAKLYRTLMRKYHPDMAGGSETIARDLNQLWQEVMNDLRGNSKKPR